MKIVADIDIDLKNRDDLLDVLNCIPASIYRKGNFYKHNVGVYLQRIPVDPITGLCSLDYKEAENRGFFKFDLLNVHLYEGVKDEEHLNKLVNTEPMWEMLLEKEIVSELFHINDHFDVLEKMKPTSIEQLAMVLALIRPGKRHMIGKSWNLIERSIWDETDDGYSFKKAHSISYAVAIVVQMNLMVEQLHD